MRQIGEKEVRLARIPERFERHVPEGRVAVEEIVQLAHVARPVVVLHRQTHLQRQNAGEPLALHVGFHKQGNVPAALAQGRQGDGKHVYPVIEIRTHLLFQHHAGKVLIGGRDQTERRYLGRVAADGGIHLVLDGPQQLHLQMNGQFPDFVKEKRTVVRRPDVAFLVGVRPGKGPLGVPEKLAFKKLLGDGPAVDRDVVALARAVLVNRLRYEVLARPRLAVDDHVGVRLGGLEDEPVDPAHGVALAYDVPQAVEIAHGSLELAVFFLEFQLLKLLLADVHHQPFEIAQLAVGVENPFALIPYPLQPPGRERNAVHHLIGLMRDNTVIDFPPRFLEIVGMRHALDGVVLVAHHLLGRDAQQIVTPPACEFENIFNAFKNRGLVFRHPAAIGETRQVVEQPDIALLHPEARYGRVQFHRLPLNVLSLFATFLSLIE